MAFYTTSRSTAAAAEGGVPPMRPPKFSPYVRKFGRPPSARASEATAKVNSDHAVTQKDEKGIAMSTISSLHDHSHAHAAPLNDDDLREPVCGMAVTSPSKFGESYQGQAHQSDSVTG